MMVRDIEVLEKNVKLLDKNLSDGKYQTVRHVIEVELLSIIKIGVKTR